MRTVNTDLVISPHFETQKMDILWLITVQNELVIGISSWYVNHSKTNKCPILLFRSACSRCVTTRFVWFQLVIVFFSYPVNPACPVKFTKWWWWQCLFQRGWSCQNIEVWNSSRWWIYVSL